MIQNKLVSGAELRVPAKFWSGWETLSGRVAGIIAFPDGYVVLFPQNLRYQLNWPDAVLWIQNYGPCGILN